jgi:hypothetical protein
MAAEGSPLMPTAEMEAMLKKMSAPLIKVAPRICTDSAVLMLCFQCGITALNLMVPWRSNAICPKK